MNLPSLRGVAITVLEQAGDLTASTVIALREVTPTLVTEVVATLERVPGLVGDLTGALGRVEQVRADAGRVVVEADRTVDEVDGIARRASGIEQRVDGLVDGLTGLLRRTAGVVAQAESLLGRAGDLLGVVEEPVRALAPALQALADLEEPDVATLVRDLARRSPDLLSQVSDDVVPALVAMQGAIPDLVSLRELGDRLEPLVIEMTETLSGLPGAKRARRRGARDHDEDE